MSSTTNGISATLIEVLTKALGEQVIDASFETKQLQGGTLGDVKLVFGMARTVKGEDLPYKVIYKTQKKWERYGDSDSWRREYDFNTSDLHTVFTDSFHPPKCYYAELLEDEIKIWMEHIEGVSGLNLTGEMYQQAAKELGRFQGRLYAQQSQRLNTLTNLSKKEYVKNYYLHYRSWSEVYDYIRSKDCEIPKHLCKMLIDLDTHSEEIWKRIEQLPVVLCHRDFWVANIFYKDGEIVLIDWDTTGFGYMGEDIASLIADEADVSHMVEYYEQCIPAYYKGFSEYADISHIVSPCIKELILFMFGYRLVEWYKFAESPKEKSQHIDTLQKIYEFGEIDVHV